MKTIEQKEDGKATLKYVPEEKAPKVYTEKEVQQLISDAKREEGERIVGKWIDLIANITLTEGNTRGIEIANEFLSKETKYKLI